MKRLKKKLTDRSGESMTELIVAFTLFMLALATLTSMVSVGLKFNRMAADADKAYYDDFEEASGKMKVSITPEFTTEDAPEDVEISYYYNDAGLIYFCFDEETEDVGGDGEAAT